METFEQWAPKNVQFKFHCCVLSPLSFVLNLVSNSFITGTSHAEIEGEEFFVCLIREIISPGVANYSVPRAGLFVLLLSFSIFSS
jgi:hypothetical protein